MREGCLASLFPVVTGLGLEIDEVRWMEVDSGVEGLNGDSTTRCRFLAARRGEERRAC